MRAYKETLNWALLMVVPFLFVWNVDYEPIRFAKISGVVIIAALSLGAFVWKRVSPALGVAIGYVLINMAVTGFGAVQQLTSICCVSSLLVALLYKGADDRFLKNSLRALSIMAAVQASWCILQRYEIDPIFSFIDGADKLLPVGFFGQQTLFGPILVIGFIASISLAKMGSKLWYLPAAIILLFIVLTNSSFTFLAFGAAVGYLLLKRFGVKIFWAGLAASLVLLLIGYLMDREILNDNGRLLLWHNTWRIYYGSFTPLQKTIGLGGGSFPTIYQSYVTAAFEMQAHGQNLNQLVQDLINLHRMCGWFFQLHNDYFQVLFEYGLVGFLSLLWILVEAAIGLYKTRSDVGIAFGAILVSIMANSLGNFPMRLQPHGVIALIAFIVVVERGRRLVE